MAATGPRPGEVRNLVLLVSCCRQVVHRGGVHIVLQVFRGGLQFAALPPCVKRGSLFEGEAVRRNVFHTEVDRGSQSGPPFLQRLSGNAEDQIEGHIGNESLRPPDDQFHLRGMVISLESLQRRLGEGLHTKADAIHTDIAEQRQFFLGQIERIGFR